MQKLKEKERVSVQPKDWVMHISTDRYPDFLSQTHPIDESRRTGQILRALGVEPKLAGYRCLLCAIPMVAGDPWLLMKEIYPVIAKQCGLNDFRCVERTIRSAIRKAWANSNDVWRIYFPIKKCPSNKEFIARLAEEL